MTGYSAALAAGLALLAVAAVIGGSPGALRTRRRSTGFRCRT